MLNQNVHMFNVPQRQ